MAHTSEQRDRLSTPLCGSRKKNGEQCRAFAGQGTDHPGVGRCKYHGGSTPSGKKNALALEVKQRMVALSVPVDDAQPHQILLNELRQSAGHVAYLREEIGALKPEEIGGERSKVLLSRFDTERDRMTRIAAECSRAGVDEAMIQIETAKATMMIQVINGAAREAGLSDRQTRALGAALRRQFLALDGDEAAAADAERRVEQLRAEIVADEQRRIEKAAQKYSGLTFPPDELISGTARTA